MDYKQILEQLEEALKEADTLEKVFDESKESINKLENIRLQAKEESKQKFDEGKYGSAVQLSHKDSVNLDTCYSTFVEMKKTFLETDEVGIQNKKGLEDIQNEMNKMMLAEKFSENLEKI